MKDKFEIANMLKTSRPVAKDEFICDHCNGKKVLDLGCARHSAQYSLNDPEWLHLKIRNVAAAVLGVDYLPADVAKLAAEGYNIIYGDVTKPLSINELFDVIVAGDLIEHLTNFDGFFQNVLRLLKDDGILIISTPNPFYADLFMYCAYKKNVSVNPEHTCWIDPITLNQLIGRYGLDIEGIHYLKKSWDLKGYMFESEKCRYDILQGRWIVAGGGNGSAKDVIASRIFMSLRRIFRLNEKLRRYALLPGLKIITAFAIDSWYQPFKRLCGMNSKLVRYSDYIAVLRKVRRCE